MQDYTAYLLLLLLYFPSFIPSEYTNNDSIQNAMVRQKTFPLFNNGISFPGGIASPPGASSAPPGPAAMVRPKTFSFFASGSSFPGGEVIRNLWITAGLIEFCQDFEFRRGGGVIQKGVIPDAPFPK